MHDEMAQLMGAIPARAICPALVQSKDRHGAVGERDRERVNAA